MKNDKEIVGTLQGFDDFVNMLLEDVTESEATPEGRRVTKLDQILLNGNNITMVSNPKVSLTSGFRLQIKNYTNPNNCFKKLPCFLFQLVPGGEMPET